MVTKLSIANYFLQFLFIRVARCHEKRIIKFNTYSFDISFDGNIVPSGVVEQMATMQWYSIIFPIIPLTGWYNNFIYIGKERSFKITKAKQL